MKVERLTIELNREKDRRKEKEEEKTDKREEPEESKPNHEGKHPKLVEKRKREKDITMEEKVEKYGGDTRMSPQSSQNMPTSEQSRLKGRHFLERTPESKNGRPGQIQCRV